MVERRQLGLVLLPRDRVGRLMDEHNPSGFNIRPIDPAALTEREVTIAKEAARIAVKEITDGFYRDVGKNVVSKALIWIGMLAVGFAVGRGWIRMPLGG